MKITHLADNRFAGIHLVEGREAANLRTIHGRCCRSRTASAIDVAGFANSITGYGLNVAAAPDVGGEHGG